MSLRDRLLGRSTARHPEPDPEGGTAVAPQGGAEGGAALNPEGGAVPDPEGGAGTGDGSASGGTHRAGRDDVVDFDPRSDGDYHCADRGLYLRFARPAVTETCSTGTPDREGSGADSREPARGEFTASGRFIVQRRFGRPVVYTVLAVRAGSMLVRRTDTAVTGPSGTAELEFTFEPDRADG